MKRQTCGIWHILEQEDEDSISTDTHQANIVETIAWTWNSSAKQDIFWSRARQLLPSQRPVRPRGGHLRLGVSSPNILFLSVLLSRIYRMLGPRGPCDPPLDGGSRVLKRPGQRHVRRVFFLFVLALFIFSFSSKASAVQYNLQQSRCGMRTRQKTLELHLGMIKGYSGPVILPHRSVSASWHAGK